MQNLLIEQRGPMGLVKTWRIRPEQGPVSFGHSKHAELRSPLNSIKGLQGVFEFRDGNWYYANVDVATQEADSSVEVCLIDATEIRIGTTFLKVVPLGVRATLFESFEGAELTKSGDGKKPFQLITVSQGAKLVETCIVPLGKTFQLGTDPEHTLNSTVESESWFKSEIGHLQIMQRTVYLESADAIKAFSTDELIDEGGRKTLYATLAGAALLALMFLLFPASQNAQEAAVASAPPTEYREIKMITPHKKMQASQPTQPKTQPPKVASQEESQPRAGAAAGSAGSKTQTAIRALGQSRISQLIGKISASAAKSSNIVITNGITAGSAPSGRALAAVGSVTESGHDWSGEGQGKGVRIGTNGNAGGASTKGMGSISTGKAGTGGVGLLEEDGEVTGGLDREVIAAYIKTQLGQILYCYEKQLSAQPDLYGKIAVKFTIGPSGGVETQRIGETTLKSATVEGCILQKVSKWKFPTPEGGTKVVVTYPFLFKSTN